MVPLIMDTNELPHEEHRPITRLLSDAPADEDAFGSHEKIAEAIASLIQSEDGGHSIGLEGKWGSGKSSVIGFIDGKLTKATEFGAEFRVVIFDAWHHQGDPLRRTFLETLIRELQGCQWLPQSKKWHDRQAELAGRKVNERSTTYPKLTRLGRKAVLSTLAIPVGLAFINVAFSGNGQVWVRQLFLFIGLVLTVAPLFVFIWWRTWLEEASRSEEESEAQDDQSDDDQQSEPDDDKGGLTAFFLSNKVTHTDTTTTISPEPTSIEFEDTFNELMSETLDDKNRRLVLVVDNLDRVPAVDAQEIWSSLRVFLERRRKSDHPWMDRFWLLVPYDRHGIAQLWERQERAFPAAKLVHVQGDETEEVQDLQEDPTTVRRRPALSVVAESFLDKSFQVRFFVPSVVLSNWRGFLLEQLTEAFPSSSPDSLYETARLVAQYRKPLSPPTPRDLKLLVNQIGVTYRIWGEDIALSIQALHALHYRDGYDIRDLLLSNQLPLLTFGASDRSDVFDRMAALLFSVEIPVARQLLLRAPIEQAMESQDPRQIQDLENTGDGFWAVLEDIRYDPPEGWAHDLELIGSWAATFNAADVLRESTRREAGDIQDWIVESARNLTPDQFPALAAQEAGFISSFIHLSPEADLVSQLVRNVTAPTVPEEQYLSSDAIPQWVDGILSIVGTMSDLDLIDKIDDFKIIPPAHSPACEEVLRLVASRGKSERFWEYFFPVDLEETIQLIELGIEADPKQSTEDEVILGFDESDLTSVIDVLDAGALSQTDRSRLIEKILTHLRSQNASTRDVPSLVRRLRRFARFHESFRPTITDSLRELTSDGTLYSYLHRLNAEGFAEGRSYVLRLVIELDPDLSQPAGVADSLVGHEQVMSWVEGLPETVVHELALVCNDARTNECSDGELGDRMLTVLHEDRRSAPLVEAALHKVVMTSGSSANFSSEKVIETWPTVRDRILEPIDDSGLFVRQLILHSELVESVVSTEFDVGYADLYSRLLNDSDANERDDYESLVGWTLAGLQTVNRETWVTGTRSDSPLFKLLIDVSKTIPSIELGSDYMAAIRDRSDEIAQGKHFPQIISSDWEAVVDSIGSSSLRETFRNSLADILRNHGGDTAPEFFDAYGNELVVAESLYNSAGLVRQIILPMIESHNLAGMRWANSFLQSHRLQRTSFPEADVHTAIMAASTEASENENEEIRVAAQELHATLEKLQQ